MLRKIQIDVDRTFTLRNAALANNTASSVSVQLVQGKGLGLVARRPIAEGAPIARYVVSCTARRHHNTPYAFAVNGVGTCDVTVDSLGPASPDGTTDLAPFANEPSPHQIPNSKVEDAWKPVQRLAPHGAEAPLHHSTPLIAARDIAAGEEITWCYGSGYSRSYPVSDLCDVSTAV